MTAVLGWMLVVFTAICAVLEVHKAPRKRLLAFAPLNLFYVICLAASFAISGHISVIAICIMAAVGFVLFLARSSSAV